MSNANDFAVAAQELAAALYGAAVKRADALRLLSSLADFFPDDVTSTSVIGSAMAVTQDATGELFRRAAIVALARASAEYEPTSADDAAAVRQAVCGALDAEIVSAGDHGQDATFNALRALRAAVSHDLAMRGAQLAGVVRVGSNLSMPAPVLAQRLYRNPVRSDELVSQANPIHPAFMPTKFKALSS